MELLDFEKSGKYNERQKAALLYASMLVWNPEGADDDLWKELRKHFSDPQIVELGAFVSLTYGQQSVIKTWGVVAGELPALPNSGRVSTMRS